MSEHYLKDAQARFEARIEELMKSRKQLHDLREKFVKKFTPESIKKMPIELYAIGNKEVGRGENFCYILERKLGDLGSIVGATAFKFGVYYGKTSSDPVKKYRFTKKFGPTHQEAYEEVKKELLNILKAGKEEDLNEIVKNRLSPMFKGKVLSTYYPERYLNIFSNDHLKHYLTHLNIDTPELIKADPVIKREALVKFKNQDAVMRNWSLDLFSTFLDSEYPGKPISHGQKESNQDPLRDYRKPEFPVNPQPEWIDLEITSPNFTNFSGHKGSRNSNPDYEKEARILKRLGNRGKKIVFELEKNRLSNEGRKNLAEKIEIAEYDHLGYDIKSFEENGEPRYIEVKTTRSKVGNASFFLSINELNKAKELQNYYVYVVFEILSKRPKVWKIKNPFRPENKNVVKTPINFRVSINAQKSYN